MKNTEKELHNGQSLVEFALLLPILMLFLMVILDLGRAVYYYSAIFNAAREGARYGTVHPGNYLGTEDAAIRLTNGLIDDTQVSAGFQYEDDAGAWVDSCGYVTETDVEVVCVTVTYEFRAATPVLARLLGSGTDMITLRSRAVMRLEQ